MRTQATGRDGRTDKAVASGTTHGLGRSWYRVRRRVILNAAESLRVQVYNQTGKRYGRKRIATMLTAMGIRVSEETLRKADGGR